jgi:hypothetical protein
MWTRNILLYKDIFRYFELEKERDTATQGGKYVPSNLQTCDPEIPALVGIVPTLDRTSGVRGHAGGLWVKAFKTRRSTAEIIVI